MNKYLISIWNWYEHHKTSTNEVSIFILTLLFGTFIRIYKEPDNPKKWRFSRLISEFMMSFLIAFTFYQINILWLHFPLIFSMTLCVWVGSLAGKIYNQVDEMINWIFEFAKEYLNKKFLSTLAIVCFVGFTATGCSSNQPVATNIHEVANKEINHSVKTVEIIKNQAIIDSLKIAISKIKTQKPECDSITNAEIMRLLERINNKKSSGNNSFGAYFDKLKNELVIYANVAQTQDSRIKELENKLIATLEKKEQKIPVKYIPRFVQVLAFIGLLLCLYILYKILKPLLLWVSRKSLPLA